MKAVFGGIIVAIVVAGGAAIALNSWDFSSQSTFTSDAVRLGG